MLFILRQSPHDTVYAQETLDILLMASTYNHAITLLFLDDGVFQLKTQQDTKEINIKNFTTAYKALSLYDIDNIYVAETALAERQLTASDLIPTISILTHQEIIELMSKYDIIFNA